MYRTQWQIMIFWALGRDKLRPVIQYEEKILSIRTILNQFISIFCFTKTRTLSIKTKHGILGIEFLFETEIMSEKSAFGAGLTGL